MPSNSRRSPMGLRADRMVRSRFTKLPPPQQQTILRAALDEFASYGFHDSSLNRIIAESGISKGSMYYYFDGKEDLYAYLTRTELEKLFATVGNLPPLETSSADEFWSAFEDYYLRLMTTLASNPQAAALFRDWAAASRSPAFVQARDEMEQASLPWIERLLSTGQRLGAVRDDLPPALLIAVVLGMGEAMDAWLLPQQPDAETLPQLIKALAEMVRRAIAP